MTRFLARGSLLVFAGWTFGAALGALLLGQVLDVVHFAGLTCMALALIAIIPGRHS